MATTIINLQRDILLEAVRYIGGREWKVLVLDENSHKLVDNVVRQDDILNENVTNIENIEDRRPMNKDMDAVYLLSPMPHIVDCLMADFERRRYRKAFLIWTSLLDPTLRAKIEGAPHAREQIADFRTLNVDFFPRESHVAVFRDPSSFHILYHPACNNLIRQHLESLAQKIVSVCVSLGEYPTVRYYKPRNPSHEASVLCSHLARFVSDELDQYARYHPDFPPPSPRPRAIMFLVDRSMDPYSPLLHEFTYQAMAMDLLPIVDGDKVIYKPAFNAGQGPEGVAEEKRKDGMELGEKDKIWVENRHMHMKDLLTKLVADFNKFRADNPQFAESTSEGTTSVNTIKDMLAGLPQFQEGKEAFSLHLNMAEECMKVFSEHKLLDIGSVEQSLATGLDEEYKKPKNLADQVVRLLDDDSVEPPDRLRLIILYLLYRDGLLKEDIRKLLAHANLPPQDGEMIYNLELLGARVEKPLKDTKPPPTPLFANKPPVQTISEEASLSRFDTTLKLMLEDQARGTLDQMVFPFVRPELDSSNGLLGQENVSQASLRSAKPTWARTRPSAQEPRQRIIVFIAGGATYAESRACYEVSQSAAKDIFLATSHMVTPALFLRQLGDLSVDRRRLDIPSERPQPKAPAHLFEREAQPPPPPAQPQQSSSRAPTQAVRSPPPPPTAAMGAISLNSRPRSQNAAPAAVPPPAPPSGKLQKKEKEEKKKKHHFFK